LRLALAGVATLTAAEAVALACRAGAAEGAIALGATLATGLGLGFAILTSGCFATGPAFALTCAAWTPATIALRPRASQALSVPIKQAPSRAIAVNSCLYMVLPPSWLWPSGSGALAALSRCPDDGSTRVTAG